MDSAMEAPKWKSQNSFKINVMEALRDMLHE
jgi:hypothetical protein